MSDVKQGFSADMLARLRGVGTGGVQAPQPKPQDQQPQGQPIGSVMNQAPAEEEKPKRDIKELYDFIDAYCSDE